MVYIECGVPGNLDGLVTRPSRPPANSYPAQEPTSYPAQQSPRNTPLTRHRIHRDLGVKLLDASSCGL